jgi:hypothetical protein
MKGIEELVFAVRVPGNDPHWYANFGYWSSDTQKMLYGKPGTKLCKLNLGTGKVETLLEDAGGSIRDITCHYDGKTILFSTHDAGLAVKMSDRIWMLEGPALREGAPEDLALDGTLERVLAGGGGTAALILDPRSGQLIPGRNSHHPVQLECSEEGLKVWTMEALGRLGYQVKADQQALFRVLVSRKEGKTVWQVQKSGKILDFHSLYDLSLYLRTIPHQTIQS